MNPVIDAATSFVRGLMRHVARTLNTITLGKLHPDIVTIIGLLAHIPIAWMIAVGNLVPAGILLIVFGLFDSLDGELARLQKRDGPAGMLLDSVTDRMKEVMLYMGIAIALLHQEMLLYKNMFVESSTNIANFISVPDVGGNYTFALVVAAAGGSLLVSYINAWGEVVTLQKNHAAHKVNQAFRGGLMRFQVRMLILIVGLLFNEVWIAVLIIAVLSWLTAITRLINVRRSL